MTDKDQSDRLISHAITQTDLSSAVNKIKQRIENAGDLEHVSVAEQLAILTQLTQFDFGRFLLMNSGINGYWTHYMLTHPWFGRKSGQNNAGQAFSSLETFLLDRAPTMLATQQRFDIFLHENQKAVTNNAALACIPCGLMGELLYLNFAGIDNISLTGIDLDDATLNEAALLADKQNLSNWTDFKQADAWHLDVSDTYDLISSNGLNIYEPNDDKVEALYRQYYLALKPGGTLVTSILTPPPSENDAGEWLMDKINQSDLMLQKTLFVDVLNVKWQCYRSSKQTALQLENSGFNEIKFLYDQAQLFPTVTAVK